MPFVGLLSASLNDWLRIKLAMTKDIPVYKLF